MSIEGERGAIGVAAMESLGLGFDLASDFRLKFAKRCPGSSDGRLVVLDHSNYRDVVLPGGGGGGGSGSGSGVIRNVPECIRCDKGDRIRFKSDVLTFNQMSELLNQKSSVQGKVPSGYFNAMFDLSGSWLNDTAEADHLAFDGYFISLYYLHLVASPLVLHDKVKKSVPSHWNPASLSRFIQTYGTHIIVGLAVGGQDIICIKQRSSSGISPADLRGYLEDLGDFIFSDGRSPLVERKTRDGKQKVPEVFNRMLQQHTMQFTSITETSSKDGLTIISSKRGGDVFSQSHSKWLQTVASHPEAISFKLVPITSLLAGVPGSGYLSHAINLYLRYKPALEDLHFFLEFQVPRQWAPLFCELPLRHQRKKPSVSKVEIMAYFTSLLNGNMYENDDIDSSQIPSPQIPQFSTQEQESTQPKKGRATNFSTEEDMLLVSAWRNISMDPIQGSNQTYLTYWERIAAFYNENKTFSSDRTANSLSHRWSIINSSVSKFIGYYNQVQRLNQSGLSEQDKVGEAMKMYSTLQKKTFQLIHCWTELRNCPKYSSTLEKKTRKSPLESPTSSASAQSQFGGTPVPESEEILERPMGKKAAKRLKKNEHDAKSDEFIAALTQVKDTVSRLSEARHESIQQLIELEKAREEREKAREEREKAREERDRQVHEMSILSIDTSTMEASLAEYYESLKAGILKKRS